MRFGRDENKLCQSYIGETDGFQNNTKRCHTEMLMKRFRVPEMRHHIPIEKQELKRIDCECCSTTSILILRRDDCVRN